MSHYDTVDPLERDFIQSWEGIEEFFGLMLARVPWKDRVLQFIAELRHAGYDRKLRAGQSIDIFIVSRSRRHGLRPEQPRVAFYFHKVGMDVLEGNEVKVHTTDLSLSAPVRAVLDRLVNRDID
jgi:hypothetical protein